MLTIVLTETATITLIVIGLIGLILSAWVLIGFNAKRVARNQFETESEEKRKEEVENNKRIESFNTLSDDKIHEILDDILDNIKVNKPTKNRAYHTASTLCIDKVLYEDVLLFQVNGKMNSFVGGGVRNMSKDMLEKVHDIYRENKGTSGYFENCVKDFEEGNLELQD